MHIIHYIIDLMLYKNGLGWVGLGLTEVPARARSIFVVQYILRAEKQFRLELYMNITISVILVDWLIVFDT